MPHPQHPGEPLVTAMVSTYQSERYLRGCLDDLLAQSIADRLEIVVVDACSPEGEGAIVREYQRRHDNIVYLRSDRREQSSLSFNRATAVARGKYLTTANTDDRHHPEFFARTTAVLEQHPEFGLVYADSLITTGPNETWANHTAKKRYAWPDYTPATALSCCLFGPQPVWRRSVHDTVGGWNPDRRQSNDLDLFLRVALQFGAVHLRETLGLFLARPDSVSGADNRQATLEEALDVLRLHRRGTPLEVMFPALAAWPHDPAAQASLWFELGNLCALGPYTDAELALQCYQRALALPLDAEATRRVQLTFAGNSANVLYSAGLAEPAARAWALCRGDAVASANAARCRAAEAAGRRPMLRELEFLDFAHPVLHRSRTARGLAHDPSGTLRWSPAHPQLPWDVFEGPSGVDLAAGEPTWPPALPPSAPFAPVEPAGSPSFCT